MTMPQTSSSLIAPAGAPVQHKSKTMAAFLAAVLGILGAHWWYLGRPKAWLWTLCTCVLIVLIQFYPVWWDNPPFLLLIIPAAASYIEALVFALKADHQFDVKYNPTSGQTTRTRWGPVVIAIFTTLVGSAVVVFGIALIVMHIYIKMGWLDGYVI